MKIEHKFSTCQNALLSNIPECSKMFQMFQMRNNIRPLFLVGCKWQRSIALFLCVHMISLCTYDFFRLFVYRHDYIYNAYYGTQYHTQIDIYTQTDISSICLYILCICVYVVLEPFSPEVSTPVFPPGFFTHGSFLP